MNAPEPSTTPLSATRVGTCGWADATLVGCGRFYPADVAKRPRERLEFYARAFSLVEVDSSYYAIPARRIVEGWVAATPPEMTFDVKAYGLFTGHRVATRSLPRDLQAALPRSRADRGSVQIGELDAGLVAEARRRFVHAIEPLALAGKLGVLLFQLPPWVGATRGARSALARLASDFAGFELAIEVRNGTWVAGAERERTLELVAAHGYDWVCVDEPQGFASSVPPVVAVTGPTAIVRFHGRNRATWEGPSKSAAERMNWLYAPDELAEWVPRVHELEAKRPPRGVHLLMNNCHEDKAVLGARELARQLRLA